MRWGRCADNMAEVYGKLTTPDGKPLDGVGRNSGGEGEHHKAGLWMGLQDGHLGDKRDEKEDKRDEKEDYVVALALPPAVKFIANR